MRKTGKIIKEENGRLPDFYRHLCLNEKPSSLLLENEAEKKKEGIESNIPRTFVK